eukprot:568474-Pelagomonas_calceolata.AAC.1
MMLITTLPQNSPVCSGKFNTQRALKITHVPHLQITCKSLARLNVLSAPHLACIYSSWDYIRLPKPQRHIR